MSTAATRVERRPSVSPLASTMNHCRLIESLARSGVRNFDVLSERNPTPAGRDKGNNTRARRAASSFDTVFAVCPSWRIQDGCNARAKLGSSRRHHDLMRGDLPQHEQADRQTDI